MWYIGCAKVNLVSFFAANCSQIRPAVEGDFFRRQVMTSTAVVLIEQSYSLFKNSDSIYAVIASVSFMLKPYWGISTPGCSRCTFLILLKIHAAVALEAIFARSGARCPPLPSTAWQLMQRASLKRVLPRAMKSSSALFLT